MRARSNGFYADLLKVEAPSGYAEGDGTILNSQRLILNLPRLIPS